MIPITTSYSSAVTGPLSPGARTHFLLLAETWPVNVGVTRRDFDHVSGKKAE
jgi:hypothetical protein